MTITHHSPGSTPAVMDGWLPFKQSYAPSGCAWLNYMTLLLPLRTGRKGFDRAAATT